MKTNWDNEIQLKGNMFYIRNEILSFLAVIIIFLATVIFFSCNCLCFLIISLIVFFYKTDVFSKGCAVILSIILNLLVYINAITFHFIPQALVLLEQNTNLAYWFSSGHMHAVRLMIAYPGYIFHKMFNISLDLAFSYYCVIIFVLLFLNLVNIKNQMTKVNTWHITSQLLTLFVIGLAYLMNGRICFAFLGISILIIEMSKLYLLQRPKSWLFRYLLVIVGIVLCMVSSGTMMVAITFVLGMFIFRIVKNKRIEKGAVRLILVGICGFPLILIGAKYVLFMANKNLTYFGGGFTGFFRMFSHGIGGVLGITSPIVIVGLVVVGTLFFALNVVFILKIFRKCEPKHFTILVSGNISFYGALFGLSTGSLIIVPILIGVCILIDYFANKNCTMKATEIG